MIKTPMKFVDSAGQGIVTIDKITVHEGPDKLLAPIPDMTNAIGTGPLFGKKVFLVVQPLQGLERLIDLSPSPTPKRFDGNRIRGQVVLAPIEIAGTGNRDAFGHGIEASLSFKFLLKGFTPPLSTAPHLICNTRSFLDGN